ncbi:MAG: hypothetical protein EKK46_02725 [Rhodocyclaceae bacterium]|nr:MAG: hypothetical protein EKK46_02725 [Rhodocyclaceae bacterium]
MALPLPPAQPILYGLNHLLGQAGWARDRLKDFAGRHAHLALGPVVLELAVTDEGLFATASEGAAADVSIALPLDAPLRMMQGGVAEVMKGAQVTGAADMADALGYVLRNLRWDAEEDLSKFVGDIAAHRIVRGAESLVAWQKDAATRLGENLSEYLLHESPQLVKQADLKAFKDDVAALADDLKALEKRLGSVK